MGVVLRVQDDVADRLDEHLPGGSSDELLVFGFGPLAVVANLS